MILDRDTHHAAPVDLILRFATANGPRTLIVPNVPLSDASAIAREMTIAGHHAEYTDHRGGKPMVEHMASLKRKQERAKARTNVVPINSLSNGVEHAGTFTGGRTGRN